VKTLQERREESKLELKGFAVGSAVLGAVYAAFGVLEVMSVAGAFSFEPVPADAAGGLCLLVVAATFLLGAKELLEGRTLGISFVVVGVALAAVFGLLYILIAVAHALMFVLGEAEELSLLAELRPEIWLALAAAAMAPYLRRALKELRAI